MEIKEAVVAFVDRSDLERAIRSALEPIVTLQVEREWRTFETSLSKAAALVVVLPRIDSAATIKLGSLKHLAGDRPLILLTTRDADAARKTTHLLADEILWLGEIESRLAEVTLSSVQGIFLSHVAVAAENAPHLPVGVRRLISLVVQLRGPVPSIQRLASLSQVSRGRLWKDWTRAAPHGPTLSRFLDWILLLRAVWRKLPGLPWVQVAEELGVHVHTLAAIATRLTQRRLSKLEASAYKGLVVQFEKEALTPLGLIDDVGENVPS